MLRLTLGESGYLQVVLYDDLRIPRQRRVNRVILETFVGPCPTGHESAHLDGNRINNRIGNLQWATRRVNHSHKHIHGTMACGTRNGMARLSEDDVHAIRFALLRGCTTVELGRRYGVSGTAIGYIATMRNWRSLPLVVKVYDDDPANAAARAEGIINALRLKYPVTS